MLQVQLKGKRVRVTKVTDTKFNGEHPMGVNPGYVKEGIADTDLTIDNCFYVTNENRMFRSSPVVKISAKDSTFETLNSVYKYEILDEVAV